MHMQVSVYVYIHRCDIFALKCAVLCSSLSNRLRAARFRMPLRDRRRMCRNSSRKPRTSRKRKASSFYSSWQRTRIRKSGLLRSKSVSIWVVQTQTGWTLRFCMLRLVLALRFTHVAGPAGRHTANTRCGMALAWLLSDCGHNRNGGFFFYLASVRERIRCSLHSFCQWLTS